MFLTEEYSAQLNVICRYLALDDFNHRELLASEIEKQTGE
jgi:hypothetical protein